MTFRRNTAVFPDAIDSATCSDAVEGGTNFFRAAGHQKALTKLLCCNERHISSQTFDTTAHFDKKKLLGVVPFLVFYSLPGRVGWQKRPRCPRSL